MVFVISRAVEGVGLARYSDHDQDLNAAAGESQRFKYALAGTHTKGPVDRRRVLSNAPPRSLRPCKVARCDDSRSGAQTSDAQPPFV